MHAEIIGSQLEIFEDADHFVFQQKSDEVFELIKKFNSCL